jgi:hypothetical protein
MRALEPVVVILIAACAMMSSMAEASAQTPPPLEPGARLRILFCNPTCAREPSVGTFVALSGDTLLWQAEASSSPRAVPGASVGKLWVSDGEQGMGGLKGAGLGLLVGVAAGVVTARMAMGDCYESECIVAIYPFAGFTLAGPIIGGLAGRKRERWREIQPSRVSVQVGPALEGRLGLRLALRF